MTNQKPKKIQRSYQVSFRPTKAQQVVLHGLLSNLCELYNAALQERREAWEICRKRITCYDQQTELTQLRKIDQESASFPATIQRNPLRRVDRAFAGFFRRCKIGQAPGYPRFRSAARYDSFEVDRQNFALHGAAISITKLGSFRIHTRHRIKGTPITLHVKRVGHKWRASVVCDVGPIPAMVAVGSPVGIDVGLTNLATLSDGSEITNPRWTREAEDRCIAN
jgi:putative transposase